MAAAAVAVALVLRLTYAGTGTVMALLTALGVAAVLVHHARVARVARAPPQWFIGLAAGAFWCNFDLGWKISVWPTTHDALGVVLTHLAASLATLTASAAALGALDPLGPTGVDGRLNRKITFLYILICNINCNKSRHRS